MGDKFESYTPLIELIDDLTSCSSYKAREVISEEIKRMIDNGNKYGTTNLFSKQAISSVKSIRQSLEFLTDSFTEIRELLKARNAELYPAEDALLDINKIIPHESYLTEMRQMVAESRRML
jgi:hypothetical protein